MPGWLSGCARTLDLFAVFDQYNVSLTPAQADWIALQTDAKVVYTDLWTAYEKAAQETDQNCAQAAHSSEELSLAG